MDITCENINCKYNMKSLPCETIKFHTIIVQQFKVEGKLSIKDCESRTTEKTADTNYHDVLCSLRNAMKVDIFLYSKAKDRADFEVITNVIQRLATSLEIALGMGSQGMVCEMKMSAKVLNSLSDLINEIAISLGDDVTPNEYDPEEWANFEKRFYNLVQNLMSLFHTEANKRVGSGKVNNTLFE